MNKWCMISHGVEVNPAIEWLQESSGIIGVSHDDKNHLYTVTPPPDLLIGIEEQLHYDDVLAETNPNAALMQMVAQAATFMLSDSSNVLTGDKWQFKAMFATPHHRLWCANYPEGNDYFESDCLAVFGTYEGLTPETASAMIKASFEG